MGVVTTRHKKANAPRFLEQMKICIEAYY